MIKSPGSPVDLSIIIVNWNSADYVRRCLQSLIKETQGITFEVLVVDNASYDSCGEMLRTEFPDATFIQSAANLGFARANNLGFSKSSGRALLFLNPDTEVLSGAIAKMLFKIGTLPRFGALGCRLLNRDRSLQTSAVQAFPTIANQVLDADYLRRLFPRSSLWGIQPLYDRPTEPVEVEMISGACMMMTRSVFEGVGRFSEEYFMYSEDVDLCYKIRKQGYAIYYDDSSSIVHFGGASSALSEESFSSAVLQRESLAQFFRTTRSQLYARLYRRAMAVVAVIRLMLIACSLPAALVARDTRRWVHTYTKWRKIFQWTIRNPAWVRAAVQNNSKVA